MRETSVAKIATPLKRCPTYGDYSLRQSKFSQRLKVGMSFICWIVDELNKYSESLAKATETILYCTSFINHLLCENAECLFMERNEGAGISWRIASQSSIVCL